MTVRLHSFVRKQFPVQAVRVTPANIEELANDCGGTLMHDGEKENNFSRDYIKVNVRGARNVSQTKARIGDWLVKQGNTWKIYKDKDFRSTFESKNKGRVDEGPSPANMPKKKEHVLSKAQIRSASILSEAPDPSVGTHPIEIVEKTTEEKPLEVRSPEAAQAVRSEELSQSDRREPHRAQLGDQELAARGLPQSFQESYVPVYLDELPADEIAAMIDQKIAERKLPLDSPAEKPRPITLDELNSQPGDPRTADDIHREGQ